MLRAPESDETDALVDWVEANCLFEDQETLSDAALKSALEEQGLGAEAPEEELVNIRKNIELRRRYGGECYPLKTTLSSVQRTFRWNERPVYAFQLLLSLRSHYGSSFPRDRAWRKATKLFERVVTSAWRGYLQGRALNVGFPRERKIRSFTKCLEYVCNELNEELGENLLCKRGVKDDYVDVIAWRSFGDRRGGQVIVLVGCTIGEDLEQKAQEIHAAPEIWKDHIKWCASPSTSFAFPHICVDSQSWRRLSAVGGILLDRLRISCMLSQDRADEAKALNEEIARWCKEQLRSLNKLRVRT
ncbi:MAG: hypothetical protein QW835_03485 [Candidatus Hadarchaeum sp.]